jgi:hypothetical protein
VKVPKKTSFDWEFGTQLRSRGTVQSDRWRGKMLKTHDMHFSLVVSARCVRSDQASGRG